MTATEIKIVLADDHQVVRFGLRTLLDSKPNFNVIGEASDGHEAVKLVETLKPDVLVLDLMMPNLNGLDVTRIVHKQFPEMKIVVLSMYDSEAYIVEALKNGASAYVLKQSTTDELVDAVLEVSAGRRYLSHSLSERAIEAYIKYAKVAKTDSFELYKTLTPREIEVLHLASQGHTNASIAETLSISSRTVETHRANMMKKLGIHSQIELIRFAMTRGIIPQSK